jgi:hypothetical protein
LRGGGWVGHAPRWGGKSSSSSTTTTGGGVGGGGCGCVTCTCTTSALLLRPCLDLAPKLIFLTPPKNLLPSPSPFSLARFRSRSRSSTLGATSVFDADRPTDALAEPSEKCHGLTPATPTPSTAPGRKDAGLLAADKDRLPAPARLLSPSSPSLSSTSTSASPSPSGLLLIINFGEPNPSPSPVRLPSRLSLGGGLK